MSKSNNTEFVIDGPVGQLQLVHTTLENNFAQNASAIICHPHPLYGGSMSNKVVHIINKAFNEAGLDTIRFNFRGVEKSQGEFANGVGEVDDLLAVVNWLTQQKKTSQLYLAGFSFGSYIAAQLATKKTLPVSIDKLLLVAPPVSMYDFSDIKITIPCLVIQGGQDTVVDPQQVKQWVSSQKKSVELEWNEQAEHFFHGKLNFIRGKITVHWF